MWCQHCQVPASTEEDHFLVFTRCNRILQDFQMLKHRSARDLKDLIQDILKNPEFSIDEVDSNMHERLLRSIRDRKIEVLDMSQEGDGEHDVRFFKRKVDTVLRELLFDERLASDGVPVLWLQAIQELPGRTDSGGRCERILYVSSSPGKGCKGGISKRPTPHSTFWMARDGELQHSDKDAAG